MTAPKISPLSQYHVWLKLQGVDKKDLQKVVWKLRDEYAISETLVRRIAKRDPVEMRSKAGIPEEKPKIRVPAPSRPLTKPDSNAPMHIASTAIAVKLPRPLLVPKQEMSGSLVVPLPPKRAVQEFSSLAPPGVRCSPVGLVRKHGTAVQVTGQGSVIVTNSEGTAVKVLGCPMYGENRRFIRVHDVEITEINGATVRGVARKWSGESITGYLVIDGLTSPDSGKKMVTRVEFHPDNLPAQYVKEHNELRRKLL